MNANIFSRCRKLEEKFKEEYECAMGDKGSAFGSLADLIWCLFPEDYQNMDPKDLTPLEEYRLHSIRIRARNAKDTISDWLPYLGELMWKRGYAEDLDPVEKEDFINMGLLIENLGQLFSVCQNLQENSEEQIERRIEWEKENPEFAMKRETVCARCKNHHPWGPLTGFLGDGNREAGAFRVPVFFALLRTK